MLLLSPNCNLLHVHDTYIVLSYFVITAKVEYNIPNLQQGFLRLDNNVQ